jgi:hypothetical protein
MTTKEIRKSHMESADKFAGKSCTISGEDAQIFRVALKGKRRFYAEIREVRGNIKRVLSWRDVAKIMEIGGGDF